MGRPWGWRGGTFKDGDPERLHHEGDVWAKAYSKSVIKLFRCLREELSRRLVSWSSCKGSWRA